METKISKLEEDKAGLEKEVSDLPPNDPEWLQMAPKFKKV